MDGLFGRNGTALGGNTLSSGITSTDVPNQSISHHGSNGPGLPLGVSTDRTNLTVAHEHAFFVLFTLSSLLIIIFNSFNLAVFARFRDTYDVTHIFYTALSVTDLITGITVLVSVPAWLTGGWPYGDIFCNITGFIMTVVPLLSAFNIHLINLDCLIKISYPLRYVHLMTVKRATVITIVTHVLIIMVFTCMAFFNPSGLGLIEYSRRWGYCIFSFDDHTKMASTSIPIGVIFIWRPAAILGIIHIRLFFISLKHARRIAGQHFVLQRLPTAVAVPVVATADQQTQRVAFQLQDTVQHEHLHDAHHRAPNTAQRQRQNVQNIYARPVIREEVAWRPRRPARVVIAPMVITFAFYCAWLPCTITASYMARTGRAVPPEVTHLQSVLFISSSWWNTVIYLMKFEAYRKRASKIIRRFHRAR